MIFRSLITLAVLAATAPAAAQDVHGLEVCTAEKNMERRTGCLQSNTEFLQQALGKLTREMHDKINALNRETAAQKAEIAALKAALAKLQHELAELKKPAAQKK
jgi:septal ring factor EnvC (AmiA/AmiB activator)